MKTCYYDERESQENAMACAQIEADKLALENALYSAAMTSDVLYSQMPAICKGLGLQYPPRLTNKVSGLSAAV